MIKFSQNSDFDFGVESVSIITDNKQLVKRAAVKDQLKFEKTAGQTDVHLIAVGSFEGYSLNRNGDLFKEADCKKKYHTFKEADRAFHRHHKNKKEDPKYGNIKAAAYNDAMRRIELIVGHDNDKCADILDEIEKKGHASYSMACKVAHDICTICGFKATSDRVRCGHIPSKIGEITKSGEVTGMINPNPNWFEISYVHRPADRIGFSLKLASASGIQPMLPRDFLQIYTGFEPPMEEVLISKKASDKRNLLDKLSEMEKHVDAISKSTPKTSKDLYLARQAAKINKSDSLSKDTIDELRKVDPSKLLKVLADHGIIFRPDEFSKYLFGDRIKDERVKGMKSHLPHAFEELSESPRECGEVLNSDKFEPSEHSMIPQGLKNMISKLMGGHSLFAGPAMHRVIRITIIGGGDKGFLEPEVKEKTKEAFDKELANQYLNYKLAALNYLRENNKLDEDVLWNAVIQNRG